MSLIVFFFLFIFGGSSLYFNVQAQEVEIIQDIHFGDVVVLNNDTVGWLYIDERGNTYSSNHFLVVNPGYQGLALLSEFAKYTQVHIQGEITQANATPVDTNVEGFTLVKVNVPRWLYTDINGNAEFHFGANIHTTGNGSLNFRDTTYTSKIRLKFLY